MKVVIQRVNEATVIVDNNIISSIGMGLLVFAAWENDETENDSDWIASKIVNLRIFNDQNGIMNLSLKEVNGDLLLVSQFTLHASTRKGNRPSYIKAARPKVAKKYYDLFHLTLEKYFQKKVQTGIFGADMQIKLSNNGPVTIIIDSKIRE